MIPCCRCGVLSYPSLVWSRPYRGATQGFADARAERLRRLRACQAASRPALEEQRGYHHASIIIIIIMTVVAFVVMIQYG